MRIIFMGTPAFAVPSLDILVKNGYNVVTIVTACDSFGGRGGKQLIESPIKKYGIAHDIPVLQPTNLKSPHFLKTLASFHADLQIVVAFRMLPEAVWNMPPMGTYNLHGSLLPKYRGAAPIHHAIIQGETTTGVTSFKLKHAIDTGDILLRKSLDISDDDNVGSVHDKMMTLGASVILETVQKIEKGDLTFLPQNDDEATAAPKIFHETCQIDFENDYKTVYNFIRGLSPFPGAWCLIDGKEMKILKASKIDVNDSLQPGEIKSDGRKILNIKCKGGYISIQEIKPEGKRIMTISEYLNGVQNIPTKVE